MFTPRPASAGTMGRRNYDAFSYRHFGGGEQVQDALLHKIELLAARHARNVQALKLLRGNAPKNVWAKGTSLPTRHKITSPEREIKTFKENSNGKSTREARQVFAAPREDVRRRRWFTRVTTSPDSRWKHETTVVEPFRSMETHATAWKRKIRQQQEHELKVKQEEEEARARDRERLVAAVQEGAEFSGVIARSKEMMERRRTRAIEAEEKEKEERKRCEFKARPVHITDEDWQTIQDRQAIRRKQRLQMRQAQMSSMSRLPRRMAMHALQKKDTAAGVGDVTVPSKAFEDSKGRAANNGRHISPERIRQVLARKQRDWDERLAAVKWRRKPVVPQVMPMEERERVYRKRAQERAQRRQDIAAAARQREENEDRRRKAKAFSAPVPVVPRTTHGYLIKTAQVQAKLERERDQTKREEEIELMRRAREQRTSKALAEVMREIDRQQGRETRRNDGREAERQARDSRKKFRRALKENKAKLEQATADRPTLWEQHDAEVRKEAAKRIALSTIAKSVFRGALSGSGKGVPWKSESAGEKIFDEEERAALGMPF